MTKLELIKLINDLRKANKNNWVNQCIDYNGIKISLKSYNTWVQVLVINGGNKNSSNMDISVKQFNEFLNETFSFRITYF